MSSDVLRVVNHFSDAPQQRFHGDITESNRKSIACCNSPVHIQTLVAEYRNPKQRHASVNSFLCAQQSTVCNEESDVGMSWRTNSTQLEIQLHQEVEKTLSLPIYVSPCLFLSLHIRLFIYLLKCLSMYLYIYIYIYIMYLSID